MKRARRLLLLLLVTLAALVGSSTALAAYDTPTLAVAGPNVPGSQGELFIAVAQSRDDDATFRLVIYVPPGYGTNFAQTPGTQVGTIGARINARAIDPNAIVELNGTIQARDPAPFRTNPQSVGCVGAGQTIDAVYMLVLQSPVPPAFEIPLYVTRITAGPEAAFAQAKMTACLPSPNVPEAQGGARLGAKLVSAELTFAAVFRAPTRSDAYRWRTVWTPYTAGSAAPNPAGTVETQSVDLPGTTVTLRARVNRRTRRVTFTGTFGNATRVGIRMPVQIRRGTRIIARARTNARGAFRVTVRLRRGRYVLRARVSTPNIVSACTAPIPGIPRCLRSVTVGFTYTSRIVRIRVR